MADETTPETTTEAAPAETAAPTLGGEVPAGGFGLFQQEPTPDAPPPAEPEATAPEPEIEPEQPAAPEEDGREAELARRDRELLERQAELRVREQQVEEFNQLREMMQTDPAGAFSRMGGNPMALAESMMSGEPGAAEPDQLQTLTQQVESLQNQLMEQGHQQQRQAELARIGATIEAGGENLAMVRALASESPQILHDVYQQAAEHYQRTQLPPDYGQILKKVEQDATEQVFTSLSSLLRVPSFKKRISAMLEGGADQLPSKPAENLSNQPGTPPQATLSSDDMEREPLTETRYMDDEERRQAALEILKQGRKQTG
ncbi:MAG: hypothetical protein CMK74_00165 [Pseudomonadales bacterium]|nr:hypothetical protein [Pseudomonadales bacterium]